MVKKTCWGPILEGQIRNQAITTLKEIVKDLTKHLRDQEDVGPSLADGHAGISLLPYYLEKSMPNRKIELDFEDLLTKSINELRSLETTDFSFYFGPLGIMWTQNHIGFNSRLELNKFEAYQDFFFLELIDKNEFKYKVDVLNGLLGLGVFGLQRFENYHLSELFPVLVSLIEKCSVRNTHGRTWKFRSPINKKAKAGDKWHYNLGLAHGSPGVISFLSAVLSKGIERKSTSRLLHEAVRWLLWVDEENKGRCFPGGFTSSVRNAQEVGRLGWCYGDLGVATSLLHASIVLESKKLRQDADRILYRSLDDKRFQNANSDASLCHGTAGVGHILNRYYHYTGDPFIKKKAIQFFVKTFEMKSLNSGLGGLPSGARGKKLDPSFLFGSTGIALSLIAASFPVEPEWDKIMLLSL